LHDGGGSRAQQKKNSKEFGEVYETASSVAVTAPVGAVGEKMSLT
jgi:hypothetical protein